MVRPTIPATLEFSDRPTEGVNVMLDEDEGNLVITVEGDEGEWANLIVDLADINLGLKFLRQQRPR